MHQSTISILSRALLKKTLLSALLKNDKAFEALFDKLKNAFTRAWMDGTTEAYAAALDRMRNLNGSATKSDLKSILAAVEANVGKEAMTSALRGPVFKLSDALWKLGAKEVGKSAGVDIKFGLPDLDSLEIIKKGNLFWVGQHWNSFTYTVFHDALSEFFDKGLTRDELTAIFAEKFAFVQGKGSVYWELLADHTATKTREIGRVTGYERAAIQYVQVRAHMDERTTEICRSLHGRIISVKRLRGQRDEYLDAIEHMNPERAKAAWPMMNDDTAKDLPGGKEIPKGIGNPPYHFRCRTITVIYYGGTK